MAATSAANIAEALACALAEDKPQSLSVIRFEAHTAAGLPSRQVADNLNDLDQIP